MSAPPDFDLTDLQREWRERRAALTAILRRFDTRGMTRPARDVDEGQWMAERGEGSFIEDKASAQAARAYYGRRYSR